MPGFAAIGLENVYLSSLGTFLDAFELVRIRVKTLFHSEAFAMESSIHLITPDGRPVRIAGGRRMAADGGLSPYMQYALIHVPGFVVGGEEALETRLASVPHVIEWLRKQHRGGALISSSGSAAFILAEAGLLNGGTAAIIRPLIPFFRRRYPGIRINYRKTLVEYGRVTTSIGSAADVELLTRLVERTATPEYSRWLAEVIGLRRRAGDHLTDDDLVINAQLWLEDRFTQRPRIPDLADAMAVSQQTLLRRFRRHLAMTPRDYIRKLRMEAAQALLLRTTRPVQQVASLVGYDDAHAFAKAFREFTGMNANRFRVVRRKSAANE